MKEKRKQIALRIDSSMQQAIEKWAADEFRSVNGQIEWILHNALQEANRLPTTSTSPTKPKQGEEDE